MTNLKPETCKYCGAQVHFFRMSDKDVGNMSGKASWSILNTDWTKHSCKKAIVKIYTDEEKQDFAIKRQGGSKV